MLFKNDSSYKILDFSNSGIMSDKVAKGMRTSQPLVSKTLQKITNYINDNTDKKVNIVNGIDFSQIRTLNEDSIIQIINYCLDNENKLFSTTYINPFILLDFSGDGIYYVSEEFIEVISTMLYRYPFLSIDLSYTRCDSLSMREKFDERFPLLKNRLILKNARKEKQDEQYEKFKDKLLNMMNNEDDSDVEY